MQSLAKHFVYPYIIIHGKCLWCLQFFYVPCIIIQTAFRRNRMTNNTLIFGDSYSTFDTYIPEGYASWYFPHEQPETDVSKVSQTWWYQVVEEANLNLILNNSWSGSTICYTGYNNVDCSQTHSFIYRLHCLINEGFFAVNDIHTVFVFGGTNDNWSDAPLGSIQYDQYRKEDLYCVLPAICYFFKTLRNTLPHAKIYCLINTDLKSEIVDCFEQACHTYHITKIAFNRIDKREGHPTIQGMQDIKQQVLAAL